LFIYFAHFVAFLIVIAAIIIGYYMPEIQFQQLSWHAPLGTAIFILTFFQVISGYIRYELLIVFHLVLFSHISPPLC
jgi:predicted glycosyltransferase